jgi:hypothetical protein
MQHETAAGVACVDRIGQAAKIDPHRTEISDELHESARAIEQVGRFSIR